MKKLAWIVAGIVIASLTLSAQQGSGNNSQASNQANGNGSGQAVAQPATTNWLMMGQGRGGAPFAWNDRDKDGICDLTGQPIGQVIGRGRGTPGRMTAIQNAVPPGAVGAQAPYGYWGRGWGRGLGRGAAWGRGMGRGMGRGWAAGYWQPAMGRWVAPPQAQSAPATTPGAAQPNNESTK